MQQDSSACRRRHLQVASTATIPDEAAPRWPAWASLLLVFSAGIASWAALILIASPLAG